MRRSGRTGVRAFMFAPLVFSAACLSSDVLVTVHPAASGTITHTIKQFKTAQVPPGASLGSHLTFEIDGLRGFRPRSMDEIRWAPNDSPGIKPALDPDVTLEFTGPSAQTPTAPIATAQAAPPDTEVYVASLAIERDRMEIGNLVNISKSPGYDNQPSFTPDGRAILFTSARGAPRRDSASATTPPTDIYRFDFATGTLRQLTATPEAEYSPAVMPDGRHISVVRVEADGTQRLWRFTLDGAEPALVLRDVEPVGYYAWVDERRVAVFVLGEPATLQVADCSTGTAEVVAKRIGRSLQRMPGGGVSFVQIERAPGEGGTPTMTVMALDSATRGTRTLIPAVKGAAEAELAWTPDGTLLMAHAGTLYAWRRGRTSWTAAADLAPLGLGRVTRLAVSPSGDRIALVAQPDQP